MKAKRILCLTVLALTVVSGLPLLSPKLLKVMPMLSGEGIYYWHKVFSDASGCEGLKGREF